MDFCLKHPVGIDTVAGIFKHPPTARNYNPSLAIEAYDKQKMLESYQVSNLTDLAKWLKNIPPPYVVDGAPTSTNIAGRHAVLIQVRMLTKEFAINQEVFLFEAHDSYLEFVASTIDKDDATNLLTCVNAITFFK